MSSCAARKRTPSRRDVYYSFIAQSHIILMNELVPERERFLEDYVGGRFFVMVDEVDPHPWSALTIV